MKCTSAAHVCASLHSKIEVMKIRMKMHSPGIAFAVRSFSLFSLFWQTFSPFQQNFFGLVLNIPKGYHHLGLLNRIHLKFSKMSTFLTCLRQKFKPKIENYGLPNVTYTNIYRTSHRYWDKFSTQYLLIKSIFLSPDSSPMTHGTWQTVVAVEI